ncbi:MAG: hypothetical protein ACLUHE_03525 [Christensenellales bacterium]
MIPDQMSLRQRGWLNDYHAFVQETLLPLMAGRRRARMAQARDPRHLTELTCTFSESAQIRS